MESPSTNLSRDTSNPFDTDPAPRGRSPEQSWIRFEEEEKTENSVATIVPTQTIQVDTVHNTSHSLNESLTSIDSEVLHEAKVGLDRSSPPHSNFLPGRNSPKGAIPPPPAPRQLRKTTSEILPSTRSSCPPDFVGDNGHTMQNIPLSENVSHPRTCNHEIRQGFRNGDFIVDLLPVNKKCPWVTKAQFKPELVPEELMAQGLTLTVEDYVTAMQVLVNDVRFNVYNVCYKRVLILWIMLGFVILLSLLFSGIRGLALFGGGLVWLIVNAVGIFVCMWIKLKLYRMLEQCMASVNSLFYKHRIMVGLDDRGKISCHKVNLIFVYFDTTYCIKYLNDMLENEEKLNVQETAANGGQLNIDQSRMDIDRSDIIITGSNSTRVSQKEKYAEKLLLRYSQRWVKEFVRKRLDLRLPLHPDGTVETGPPTPPRHCDSARCPCQFIEEHLRFKPTTKCSIRDLCS
ncbi:transmembrane protein 268 [Parasteatoda tepidariorum]|nr:uncharacterized protein LOC107445113 [Parasteatoda tepidariorum]XP_015914938.1 uncharacterized protein LOC107445113 [Parasteatoda tepidariorum]